MDMAESAAKRSCNRRLRKPAAIQTPFPIGIALAKFTHNRPRHAQLTASEPRNQIIDMPQTIEDADDAHHITGLRKLMR